MSYNVFALNPSSVVFSLYQDEDITWKPMWFMIESECGLTNINGIFKNDGKIISKELASQIGIKLKEILKTNKINEYIEKFNELSNDNSMIRYDKELIKEFSNFCINSRGFKIL